MERGGEVPQSKTPVPRGGAAGESKWVAAWRDGVRSSSKAIWLVELESTRFLALSPAAAELLGTTPDQIEGLEYLQLAERPDEAALTFQQARERQLDGARLRRRFRRPDGSTLALSGSGWAVRSPAGPDMAIWIPDCPTSEDTERASGEAPAIVRPRPAGWGSQGAAATLALDDRWRVAQATAEATHGIGHRPADLVGTPILELTHPDDVPTLLMVFAQATTESSAAAPVRIRDGSGAWRAFWALVTVQVVRTRPRFVLALDDGGESEAVWSADTLELTSREEEVVSRLLRGQRVATMAKEMYLSPTTIRNHLTAVFRKAGVHSQHELIELLGRPRPPDPK
jgi:PAS domain S-box-containing protein